ncbi:MAG TPA: hypothetical protein VJ506_03285, partial [Candidatus Limnocylindrales bacterium]|nr:hypothetical protein [Candidatus Limnocylindrales bacterium]
MVRLAYPEPPRSEQVDDYHGTRVADPYRVLEDTDDPASRAWIEAEAALTERVLATSPARAAIRKRLAELWNVPRSGPPWRRGRRWFQLRNTGLQDQNALWTSAEPAEEGKVLLDPNVVDTEGTTSLGAIDVSESGELVAAALSHAGSDWRRWRVRDASTGRDLPDRVDWSKFTAAAWTHDDAGFFYGRYEAPPPDATYEAPNRDMQLRYHRLGTDPATDPIVLATPHQPEWVFEPEVSHDGRLLVVSIWRGTDPENRVYVGDLGGGAEAVELRPLLDAADAAYVHVETLDGTMYLWTDRDAPLGRVVAIDLGATGDVEPALREIVGEGRDAIEKVALVGGRLAVVSLHDAHHRMALVDLDGGNRTEVALPGIGKIEDLAGRPEDEELYLTFVSFAI